MIASAPPVLRSALALRVTGVVQGVGFRPFIHRLAVRHALTGWVRNTAGDVLIEVQGGAGALEAFRGAIETEAPPLARIECVSARAVPVFAREGFSILESEDEPDRRPAIPPDVALCPACQAELGNPTDRRYRYPFLTCTDCGPRFTIIAAVPYDRERTSMAAFGQCAECRREYRTPGDRRYHSESNSCPSCGPKVWGEESGEAGREGRKVEGNEAAIGWAAELLRNGRIIALRGMGGFHLAVDATNEIAVTELRRRKRRKAKPLAVMVRDLDEARALADLSSVEEALLISPERPIVLVPRRPRGPVAPAVAPGLQAIGLLLPSTPLHILLLEAVGRPLVMTSGNQSDEPIAIGNQEGRERLGAMADGFLLHDREILSRCDDSVLRVAEGLPIVLRRARGYAPLTLALPLPSPEPLVAVGPHLKNTFTLAHGRQAFVSQHLGDLESLESLEHFRATLAAQSRLFRIVPEVVVRDLHPGYLSTRVAEELGLGRIVAVQHHHAHIAAVAAEHGVSDRVLGVAFDGTGYGDDGAIWGAELLLADLVGYRRLGHLRYVPMPGGNRAVRSPWRVALGYAALNPDLVDAFALAFEGVDRRERAVAERQIAAGLNTPHASSMGRLFDAAAAVLGVRQVAEYEGQAAMELEALAGRREGTEYRCDLETRPDGMLVLDPTPLLEQLGTRRLRGEEPADLAADFHASISCMTTNWVRRAAEVTGVFTVALGGGVFQNARLLASLRKRLAADGFRVLTPLALPPNDGAVSYGQAAVAAARLTQDTC